jgi:AbrB family transcriptional regulator, transcriptional pleiotropic regulator of transition state genes
MTMKATGVVRKVDELGRVVIPIELRRNLGIAEKDGLEIFVDDEKIILKRYAPACIFCDSAEDIRHFKGRNICGHCIQEIGAD